MLLQSDLPVVPTLLIEQDVLNNFNKGLTLYNMREWESAQEFFNKALECDDEDFLSRLYLQRSIGFLKNPPANDWDGVITLEEK